MEQKTKQIQTHKVTVNPCSFCSGNGGIQINAADCPNTSCSKHTDAINARITQQDKELAAMRAELESMGAVF